MRVSPWSETSWGFFAAKGGFAASSARGAANVELGADMSVTTAKKRTKRTRGVCMGARGLRGEAAADDDEIARDAIEDSDAWQVTPAGEAVRIEEREAGSIVTKNVAEQGV